MSRKEFQGEWCSLLGSREDGVLSVSLQGERQGSGMETMSLWWYLKDIQMAECTGVPLPAALIL